MENAIVNYKLISGIFSANQLTIDNGQLKIKILSNF